MTDVEAILVVRNGAKTLPTVLAWCEQQGVPVIAADHGSTDETWDILARHRGGVVSHAEREPYDGAYAQERQITLKMTLLERVRSDWILHLDADEVMEAPWEGSTLGDLARDAERGGAQAVEFDEFVFVPRSDDEDHTGADFVRTMRHYYHFAPPARRLQRLFRRGVASSRWVESAGHAVCKPELVHPARGRHRHYMGLSLDDLRAQYLPRVFPAAELTRGWHGNRVATSPDFIRPPDPARLFDLDRDGWRTDRPERTHLVFHQPARPPRHAAPRPATQERRPMPFIVGTGRSGTTLLRMLMDAHPALAIPPETHWLGRLINELPVDGWELAETERVLSESHNWQDMRIGPEELRAIATEVGDRPERLLRGIYAAYAQRHGAERVGDKTPMHGLRMQAIHQVLPEAAFVHVVRDGRDVACSYKDLWFGPGDDPREAAKHWTWRVGRIRQESRFVPRYLEVRYEALVTDTERTLREVCAFCELDFDPCQLLAHERATERLAELADLDTPNGVRSAEERRSIHLLTERPPDESRIGRWRHEMDARAVRRFEAIAGPLLADLGYDVAR